MEQHKENDTGFPFREFEENPIAGGLIDHRFAVAMRNCPNVALN
jgi:hypothetical protein